MPGRSHDQLPAHVHACTLDKARGSRHDELEVSGIEIFDRTRKLNCRRMNGMVVEYAIDLIYRVSISHRGLPYHTPDLATLRAGVALIVVIIRPKRVT